MGFGLVLAVLLVAAVAGAMPSAAVAAVPAGATPSAAVAAVPAGARCAYEVRYAAGSAVVGVRLSPLDGVAGPRTLVIPRAVPMAYEQHPYDRFVSDLRAFAAGGAPLPVRRDEGPRWIVGAPGQVVQAVEYQMDVAKMEREVLAGVDAAKIRPGYVGLLGYAVLGFIDGLQDAPQALRVTGPPGWPVLRTLDLEVADRHADRHDGPAAAPVDHWSRAENFYVLADSQILMGPDLQVQTVRAGGQPPLQVALYREADADLNAATALAGLALGQVTAYFGAAPFPRYTVHLEVLRPLSPEHRYGFSIEHRDSTSICLDPAGAAGLRAGADPADRQRALFNLIHHIAHAWIPERCAGPGYQPFPWEVSPVLDTIWLSEGFVQYVAIDLLVAAAALPPAQAETARQGWIDRRFRQHLAGQPAFLRRLSLVELSRLGSDRYGADFRIGRALFARGGLLAAELDARIRERSAGKRSLRDALRHLCGDSGQPFEVAALPSLFTAATGVDTADIWARWLGEPAPR